MINDKLAIIAVLLSSAIINLILAIISFRRRNTVGVIVEFFSLVLISIMVYSFGYAMELLNQTLKGVMFWLKFEHVGIQSLPVLWLLFALCVTGNEKWITSKKVIVLFIIPVVMVLGVFTNSWLNLVHQNPRLVVNGPFFTLHFDKGFIYWVSAVYINLILVISTVLFINMLIRSTPPFRKQAALFVVSSVIPWTGMGLYLSGNSPYNLDFSPIALSISSLIFAAGVFGFHVMDVVPLARDMIFEGMSDGVLVLDQGNRIVDFNPAFPLVIPEVQKTSIGISALDILKPYPELVGWIKNNSAQSIEIQIGYEKNPSYYQSKISPVIDRQKRVVGKLLTLHDFTDMKRLMQQLQDLATLDGLTGVFNRRYFNELANREIMRAGRYDGSLSLVMFDIDYFKSTNDTYGHAAGDAVLVSVAKLCCGMVRHTDIFGRYGGEEFMILLPQTDLDMAMVIAERLRKAIKDMRIIYKKYSIAITASFGVISVESKAAVSLDEMLHYADQAVYEAKEKGRNRVCDYKP